MTAQPDKSPQAQLGRLADALADDIMALSDEEVIAEVIEDGGDPEQIARECRQMVQKVIRHIKQR